MMRLTTLFSLFLLSVAVAMAGPRPYSSNILGDVNADGEVDVRDITELIDIIMNSGQSAAADVNNDGEIDVRDITGLIDIIMNS